MTVRVGVVDEHEIFRLGVVSCLSQAPGIEVVYDGREVEEEADVDVVIVSAEAERRFQFPCPVVICAGRATERGWGRNPIVGVLPRAALTSEQLIASANAAAAGLQIESGGWRADRLTDRGREVLRLLATGADTHEIAESLSFSERTIKLLVHEIEQELGARSRAQAVAEGIRLGLI
jgi:DNA-binding NarL/FixJ family response regulator